MSVQHNGRDRAVAVVAQRSQLRQNDHTTLSKHILAILIMLLLTTGGAVQAQSARDTVAQVSFNGITFRYDPTVFGAVLPAYDEGTPYQTEAPYFANIAPHSSFMFMRPDPARPAVDLTGELRVYKIADLEAYSEPSYKAVVEQLRTLDTDVLSTFETVSADYNIPALPFMPVLNATQVFRAHPSNLDFASVNGIEYFAYYSQSPEPILDGQVMYVYQGITTDGSYYLSFSIYVQTGLLETAIAADLDRDAFVANYAPYLQDAFSLINGADPAAFTPATNALHSFIESIAVEA